MEKIKVAIIGTGNIAQKVHLPQFCQSSICEVVAVCSRDRSKAESVAKQFSIPQSFSSVDEMLAIAKPGVVVICTPNAFHFDYTMKSLQSGSHVFCEKPPAISSREAEEMANMSKKANKMLAYNFNMRQQQEALIIKQKIDEGFFWNHLSCKRDFCKKTWYTWLGELYEQSCAGRGGVN